MNFEKIARNLLKVGQVNSINQEKGSVKVIFKDKDDIISEDLPMLSFEYNMPQVGDQVLCLFQGNGLEKGFCIGSFFSKVNEPMLKNKNIYHKKFDDNTHISFNKINREMKITVDSVDIKIQGGNVTISADKVFLSEENGEGVPLGDTLKQWLDNHTHPHPYGSTSSPSNPSPEPSERVKVK